MQQSMTFEERAKILEAYFVAMQNLDEASDGDDDAAWSRAVDEVRRCEAEYFERLPRIPMGCCPYCGKPLIRTFDPYGFDGLWWDCGQVPSELSPCPHFCVLRGAVHFQDTHPKGGNFESRTGPEVPYVIPRILEMPTMQAVVGQLAMENGCMAYFISYFADKRPPVQTLTADWPRKLFNYTTDLGIDGWNIPNDIWDFSLLPWAEQGKLRWCEPDSGNTVLSDALPAQCPYLEISGNQLQFFLEEDQRWTTGLPDGEKIYPSHMD